MNETPQQLTRDDLKSMTSGQIVAARDAGQLARLLGHAEPKAGPLTRDDLRAMTPEEIVAAKAAGQLDHLLNPTTAATTATTEEN